jgi:hypothetical protein
MFVPILIIALAVVLTVTLHLAVLRFLHKSVLPKLEEYKRIVVGVMVLGAIIGHLVEIGVFALWAAILANQAAIPHEGMDPVFWSATAYTSLGSDYPKVPEIRLLTAVEALTGLILITWTASFLFLLMQQFWQEKAAEKKPG